MSWGKGEPALEVLTGPLLRGLEHQPHVPAWVPEQEPNHRHCCRTALRMLKELCIVLKRNFQHLRHSEES